MTGDCERCDATDVPLYQLEGDANSAYYCRTCDEWDHTRRSQCTCDECHTCALRDQLAWERDPWPGYISRYQPR